MKSQGIILSRGDYIMQDAINITKKRGEDGYRTISIRIKEETVEKIDNIGKATNRTRNDIINILLENAVPLVHIQEK